MEQRPEFDTIVRSVGIIGGDTFEALCENQGKREMDHGGC